MVCGDFIINNLINLGFPKELIYGLYELYDHDMDYLLESVTNYLMLLDNNIVHCTLYLYIILYSEKESNAEMSNEQKEEMENEIWHLPAMLSFRRIVQRDPSLFKEFIVEIKDGYPKLFQYLSSNINLLMELLNKSVRPYSENEMLCIKRLKRYGMSELSSMTLFEICDSDLELSEQVIMEYM